MTAVRSSKGLWKEAVSWQLIYDDQEINRACIEGSNFSNRYSMRNDWIAQEVATVYYLAPHPAFLVRLQEGAHSTNHKVEKRQGADQAVRVVPTAKELIILMAMREPERTSWSSTEVSRKKKESLFMLLKKRERPPPVLATIPFSKNLFLSTLSKVLSVPAIYSLRWYIVQKYALLFISRSDLHFVNTVRMLRPLSATEETDLHCVKILFTFVQLPQTSVPWPSWKSLKASLTLVSYTKQGRHQAEWRTKSHFCGTVDDHNRWTFTPTGILKEKFRIVSNL